jgi:hypothetical protein
MSYVDPERFKRFQSFLRTHVGAFAKAAQQGFKDHGPGVLLYRAPDDQFLTPVREFRFEYKTKAAIEAAQAGNRDELIQGMLERYSPPDEVILAAVYPDSSYDVTRVSIQAVPMQGLPGTGA